jgi:hypothetical protein
VIVIKEVGMKRKLGSEMKKLIFWATFITLLLLIVVIAYFMVDVAVTTDNNLEQNKQLMIDQAVATMNEMGSTISGLSTDTTVLKYFNMDLINRIIAGDWDAFNDFAMNMALSFYPVEYVGISQGDALLTYGTADGFEVDPSTLPTQPPEGEYTTMDKLGDQEGFFISVFYPVDLKLLGMAEINANFIVDRTAELQAIEDTLESQRSDLLVRLSIAAVISIILFILLTTLGLRLLVDKYVMRPVDELNDAAQGIVTGTFEGEVAYDPDSSFAPIQGLLRSGQKVLSRMDEELGEE